MLWNFPRDFLSELYLLLVDTEGTRLHSVFVSYFARTQQALMAQFREGASHTYHFPQKILYISARSQVHHRPVVELAMDSYLRIALLQGLRSLLLARVGDQYVARLGFGDYVTLLVAQFLALEDAARRFPARQKSQWDVLDPSTCWAMQHDFRDGRGISKRDENAMLEPAAEENGQRRDEQGACAGD